MHVYVGNDLVFIPDFSRELDEPAFVERVFTLKELAQDRDPGHLAGLFATKEAFFKATQIHVNNWTEIEVLQQRSGKPTIAYESTSLQFTIISLDVSISHVGDYALATCVVLGEDLETSLQGLPRKKSFKKPHSF